MASPTRRTSAARVAARLASSHSCTSSRARGRSAAPAAVSDTDRAARSNDRSRRALRGFGLTYREAARDYPIARIATVEEIARAVMFLSSDEATVVTGTNMDVTGGYLAK